MNYADVIRLAKKEHEYLREDDLKEVDFDELKSLMKNELKGFLEFDEDEKIKTGYYIGYRWIKKNKILLKVTTKVDVDYFKMFKECLEDEVVVKKLHKVYDVFTNEPLIEIEKDEITPFVVLHFLALVQKITKKGLKKGYKRVEENLTSKIKGKVLISKNIKYNLSKSQLHKNYCHYEEYSIDFLENQILKSAILACKKLISKHNFEEVEIWIKELLVHFELVSNKKIEYYDFFKVKHSPFFKEYKSAFELAKLLFKRIEFFDEKHRDKKIKIFPYQIKMPELFERYIELKLRKAKIKYIDGNRESVANCKLRPDFLLPEEKIILDAKYKFWYYKHDECNKGFKEDLQQLATYSLDNKIRNKLNIPNDKIVEIIIVYPNQEGIEEFEIDKKEAFKLFNLYKLGIKILQNKN
jgi:5-methylcytosine-specific restriction endonuclease McrBC regulatory subunit McrC